MVYWIWLTQLKGIGPVLQKRLLNKYKDPSLIFTLSNRELLEVEGIGKSLANLIVESKSLEKANRILDDSHKLGIKLLTYNDKLYNKEAREVKESPILLYYRGEIREKLNGVAIVGARRCTQYGKKIAIDAAEFVASNGGTVISGMAKGIDSYAHTACLKKGGYTIAFIGSGVDICYPKEHDKLMQCIIENGAVLSSYPPKTHARPENFIIRNALISAWSKKVLLVEASTRSGALKTVEFAKSHKRKVLIVPHEIYSETGQGCNMLLSLSEKSKIYLSPQQLLDSSRDKCIEKDIDKNIVSENSLTFTEKNILKIREHSPLIEAGASWSI